jgi:hypothetical protein
MVGELEETTLLGARNNQLDDNLLAAAFALDVAGYLT